MSTREPPKGNPIPTKFETDAEHAIQLLKDTTGLSKSEIIRRGVRLLRIELAKRSRADQLRLLIDDLAPPQDQKIVALKVAEQPVAKFKAKSREK